VYGYDYLGDKTMTETPDGSVTTATFDGAGDQLTGTDGAGDTSSQSYGPQGQLAAATAPDGSSEAYGYDQAGNLTTSWFATPPSTGTARS
jgi:YD repeat-containing protein